MARKRPANLVHHRMECGNVLHLEPTDPDVTSDIIADLADCLDRATSHIDRIDGSTLKCPECQGSLRRLLPIAKALESILELVADRDHE